MLASRQNQFHASVSRHIDKYGPAGAIVVGIAVFQAETDASDRWREAEPGAMGR